MWLFGVGHAAIHSYPRWGIGIRSALIQILALSGARLCIKSYSSWKTVVDKESSGLVTCSRGLPKTYKSNGLFQKNSKRWQRGKLRRYRFSRDIKERTCGNPRGQLKKKWSFKGCSRKFMWNLHGSRFLTLESTKGCHTISQNLQGWELICFLRVSNKSKNSRVFFQKGIYILNPLLFGVFLE